MHLHSLYCKELDEEKLHIWSLINTFYIVCDISETHWVKFFKFGPKSFVSKVNFTVIKCSVESVLAIIQHYNSGKASWLELEGIQSWGSISSFMVAVLKCLHCIKKALLMLSYLINNTYWVISALSSSCVIQTDGPVSCLSLMLLNAMQ